jgi:hypothetical protein
MCRPSSKFSVAVICGNNSACWNARPTRARDPVGRDQAQQLHQLLDHDRRKAERQLVDQELLPNANSFGDLRRSTLSWCQRTRISASNAARDRNSPIKAHQINLQRSLIGSEYQPIRGRGQRF